jgi:hypothetical protein
MTSYKYHKNRQEKKGQVMREEKLRGREGGKARELERERELEILPCGLVTLKEENCNPSSE